MEHHGAEHSDRPMMALSTRIIRPSNQASEYSWDAPIGGNQVFGSEKRIESREGK